jgi:glycosyltransferase involved in cell wall biosynthesis
VPMAAMDTGGTRDIIEHERTGLLSSTAGGLAADLSRLLGDPELASRLGAGAQSHVISTFDASVVVAKIEALYQDVMASQRSGADRG